MNLFCRVTLIALLCILPMSRALAGLMLYPTRIVFEGNDRAAQLELINTGAETETYRISLVNRHMSETGAFLAIDVPITGEKFADDKLRYSPRQVTLAPGVGQTIRIMVRKPANLASGEYRSHLLLAKQPDSRASNSVEGNNTEDDDNISITLTTLVSTTIPVIVRHGNTDASITMTHLKLQRPTDKAPVLTFILERDGNESVYGDLTISFTPDGGSEQVLERADGVAVYFPNPLRRVSIKLNSVNSSQFSNGILRVTYREQAEDGGKLMAKATLQLP
jgi:P pilus assembly chaperone PapD